MSGPLFVALAVCGTLFLSWNWDMGRTWKSYALGFARVLALYVVLFIIHLVLYFEVVLKWLVF